MAIFYNQATLSYRGLTTTSNTTVGEITAAISAVKTALTETYSAGENVTYVISLVNNDTTNYTGLTVTDDLGAYTIGATSAVPLRYVDGSVKYYVNGVLTAPPTVTTGTNLVFGGLNIPACGNAVLVYEATVTNTAPLAENGTITNTAVITGGGLSTPISTSETINVIEESNLSIVKSVSPLTVSENGTLTYTFVIQNYGNTEAAVADNVVVTDTFNPILSGISVTYNGAPWTSPTNYTYNEATGLFSTIPGQITVPAATFTQNPTTGEITVTPGVSTLTVTGTI